MMRTLITLISFWPVFAFALTPEYPVQYNIEVKLDTAAKTMYGSQSIQFLNPVADTLTQLCFHLYPNAFRDTTTVFAQKNLKTRRDISSGKRAELKVRNLSIDGISLDSTALKENGTLLYVSLPRPLSPGESLTTTMEFELILPEIAMRFGFSKTGNYLLSHWHPIICGYQKGRVRDFEYYPTSEFFSNFSGYNVRMDIPVGFSIGSTGTLSAISDDSSRAIWQANADSVIDFAFVCGPAFDVSEKDTLGIKIRYFIEKSHIGYKEQAEQISCRALAYFSEKLGRYPYDIFTIVDMAVGAEGMELPGLITVSFPNEKMKSVARALLNEAIVHEIAHQWFYAMIATNEAEEPWLDEGFASYFTDRLLEAGGDSLTEINFWGYKVSLNYPMEITGLITEGSWPVNMKSWDFPDDFNYVATVYSRASATLKTLEQVLGRQLFDSAILEYAGAYRFRHPDTEDLQNSLQQSTGENLDGFFNQFVNGTSRLDYSITSLKSEPIPDSLGSNKYKITVGISRELDGAVPQRLKIALQDGTSIDTLYQSELRIDRVELISNSKPVSANLLKYALDENQTNNSFYRESFGSRIVSFEWDMAFFIELFLALFI